MDERLRAEGLSAVAWSNGPGDRYGVHVHAYDKVIVVVHGSIRFGLPGRRAGSADGGAVAGRSGRAAAAAERPAGAAHPAAAERRRGPRAASDRPALAEATDAADAPDAFASGEDVATTNTGFDTGIDLVEGDRLELPAGTTHTAEVGPDGVTCLESHLMAGRLPELRHRRAGEW